jgi:hypothetical protein
VNRLVYFESFQYVNNAIARETQIKGWRREEKVALIEAENPTWAADCGQPAAVRTAGSSLRSERQAGGSGEDAPPFSLKL